MGKFERGVENSLVLKEGYAPLNVPSQFSTRAQASTSADGSMLVEVGISPHSNTR